MSLDRIDHQSYTTSVAHFVNKLSQQRGRLSAPEIGQLLTQSHITRADLAAWTLFNPELYTRSLVFQNEHFELRTLCWLPGQSTPIHDHKNSACAVKVISGHATEIVYTQAANGQLIPCSSTRYSEGAVVFSEDEDTHQMANFEGENETLVTLHCYSPPLSGFRIFDATNAFFSDYQNLVDKVSARLSGTGAAVVIHNPCAI